MSTPLLTIANLLMDEARKAGATASRVSVSQGENISVSVCNGADEGAEMNNGISVALRVFIGQNSFAATTSALGEQELRAFARRAVQLCIAPDPYAGLPDAQDYAQNPQAQLAALDLYDAYWPDAATLTDMARELDTIVMAHPDVSNTEGSSVSAGSSYSVLADSNGFTLEQRSSWFSAVVEAIVGHGQGMKTHYGFESARHFADLPSMASLAVKTADEAAQRLVAGKLTSGKMPVVFHPRVGGGAIRGSLATLVSGEAAVRGATLLKSRSGDRLVEQVFGANVQLIDDRARVRGLGSRVCDGVGIAGPKQLTLIENGVPQCWGLGLRESRQLGLRPNGRGSASNLYMPRGSHAVSRIFDGITHGFYVTGVKPKFDPTTGNYSAQAEGFVVENGQLSGFVDNIALAGNLLEMLRNAIFADDFTEKYNIPTVRVEQMMVAQA